MKFPGTYITPNGVFSIARKSRDVSSRSICPRRTSSWPICPRRTTSYSHLLRDLSSRTICVGMSIARRSAYSGTVYSHISCRIRVAKNQLNTGEQLLQAGWRRQPATHILRVVSSRSICPIHGVESLPKYQDVSSWTFYPIHGENRLLLSSWPVDCPIQAHNRLQVAGKPNRQRVAGTGYSHISTPFLTRKTRANPDKEHRKGIKHNILFLDDYY